MRLAWQTGMFAKAVLCQEQITAGALRANEGGRQSRSDQLRSRRGRSLRGLAPTLLTRT
ncbi:hypothetical protein [Gilliamella apis]|uniref:hypothetical protein n=1 Tax=Gilliamella apis TaxID=1970738 RepID=UPI0013FD109F|nr:hypothetical protein [Gilliamella apis]